MARELSVRKPAARIRGPHNAVSWIMNGERSISAQIAIRLGLVLDTILQILFHMQMIYDGKRATADAGRGAAD